ncbi:MAG: RES family NAD+ phosphorylase [Cyclobacteriaceae bacterium]
MNVFRITLFEYANQLFASGRKARWNSNGVFIIYAASSRALACLENVVHRSGEGLNNSFRTMVISIPNKIVINEVTSDELPSNWKDFDQQYVTRAKGDQWIKNQESAVLKVPSVIIQEEHNYLINPLHREFSDIQLESVEPFLFDPRLLN